MACLRTCDQELCLDVRENCSGLGVYVCVGGSMVFPEVGQFECTDLSARQVGTRGGQML